MIYNPVADAAFGRTMNHITHRLQFILVKYAVLGGGLTGLTLARHLMEKGDEVVVLEREQEPGGLCRSVSEEGFTFDIGGSHIIFSRDTGVLDFMNNLIGDNRETRIRNTKIRYGDRYIKYPFENGLDNLPKDDLFYCINEFIKTLVAVEKGELKRPENFREWILYTFGKGIADCYMIPYNEKIWNYPSEKMSLHWVDGRIPRPPVEDIIKSAVGIETEGYTHQSVFSYPVIGGIGAIISSLEDGIGERIITGFDVKSVKRDGDGYVITNGSEEIIADRCISTIPVQHLVTCLENVPDNIIEASISLKYNSIVTIGIGLKGKVPEFSWLYIPDEEQGFFNRVSFPSNYSTKVAPEGCSSILAEITYNEGDYVSRMGDDEIIAHTVDHLETMGLLEKKDVIYTRCDRFRYAYVVYDLNYLKNIGLIREYFRGTGIDLVGRFSEFEYLNMDGCIRHVLDYTGDHAE